VQDIRRAEHAQIATADPDMLAPKQIKHDYGRLIRRADDRSVFVMLTHGSRPDCSTQ
jgi:Rad3-related DNA helicase